MDIQRNIIIDGPHIKPILADSYLKDKNHSVVVFCHGYKGFKDWGCWDLAARRFADEGHHFIKFNFSHNGGTVEQPLECPDPEAFGRNNFSIELDDLERVTDWIFSDDFESRYRYLPESLTVIGHSRGGGIAVIQAEENQKIDKVVSWAGVSDFKSRFANEEALSQWKQHGVIYIENSRTKQKLPHYIQFYEDFVQNESRLTISRAVKNLEKPYLIVHGDQDPTVDVSEARNLNNWNEKAELTVIEGADHVFGGAHPWQKERLPSALEKAVKATLEFIDK
ncbi:alpha/beta hydrolase family protein [Robertkochia aurantiaca]|uniref:alpha/beta hydrolase family protein n=1 Tax=Robertkochia aurantiaca TaxID=2873700 RepID=UPI001CC9BAEE|nr:alpha/beta fold hydrolase [Robertkochia sp. 3YJGBD-33]